MASATLTEKTGISLGTVILIGGVFVASASWISSMISASAISAMKDELAPKLNEVSTRVQLLEQRVDFWIEQVRRTPDDQKPK